jgi:hypothetical protein
MVSVLIEKLLFKGGDRDGRASTEERPLGVGGSAFVLVLAW